MFCVAFLQIFGSFGVRSGSVRDPFGVRSGSVRNLFRVRSESARGPFGVRSGSVRGPCGVRSEPVRGPKAAAAQKKNAARGGLRGGWRPPPNGADWGSGINKFRDRPAVGFKQGSDRTAFPERERFDVNFHAPNTTFDVGPARTLSNPEPEQNM